ncbi:MAG TPA: MobF family relaxase [Solirubrobacterales bacterium]|jgi:conjugative relaxase-like TrwC/TraI family protein|nr:MobF family relaxase [Solirubrobacterales bacterium]
MLSAGKLGRGQERYYLEKVAEGAEDYYSGEGEQPGQWAGDAAAELGLSGEIEPDQLVAMLTGRNPATGEPLGLRHVEGGAVPGFDLTFSAPKSVSLTWALAGPPAGAEVKEAHAAAVAAGLDYLQEVACFTRRGAGGHEFVSGNGYLAAAYTHRSSRAGDPQLHTHVLIANATRGPDGRWTRLYHPGIYDHLKSAGYIYEAHLRDELTRRLGVRWGEVRNGIAEIEGFDPDHLRAFSTRRAEILEAAGGESASARAMQVATLATREAKDTEIATESLRDLWRAKAQEIGLDREAIHATFGHQRQAPEGRVSLAEVERSLTTHASHFDRRGAIQAVADNLPAGASGPEVVELADAVLARPEVVRIAETPKGPRFTTREIWELEQQALATVEQMALPQDCGTVSGVVVSRVLAQRPSLKPDQRRLVERLLAGGEGVVVVIGEAGTGKTYALAAAAQGWSALPNGPELRVAAPTWRAANVLRSEGLGATSVARLLAELDRATAAGGQALARGSVLVVDEAGMVDSRAMGRLISHAERAEAKLVLIGDPAQLGEIEAGGLFAAIAARTEPVVLDEVVRHRHDLDRDSAKLIREGRGRDAVASYFKNERVTVSDDPLTRREVMVADWWQSFSQGEDALMLAKRNAEVRELNAMARERRAAEARLGAEEIVVGEASFAAGDQVITRINDQRLGVFNRERWRIAEVDAESRRLVLDGIDTRGRVCVDSVFLERVNPRDGAPAIEHAYAATIYQAQGATLDSAFVMADPSMTREEFYVAASRTRGETFLYATPEVQAAREEIAPPSPYLRSGLDHIAEAAERSGAQTAAMDEALRSRFAQMPSDQLASRLRELRAEVGAEHQDQEAHRRHAERVKENEQRIERIERIEEAREGLPGPGRRERRADRAERERSERDLDLREALAREEAERLAAEARELPDVRHEARAEGAVIESVLADRERLAATAARISPPDYITAELGERPADATKAAAWDKAVRRVEGYRLRNGVVDRGTVLGPKPRDHAAQVEHSRVRERLERAQRELGLQRQRASTRSLDLTP